MADIAIDTQRSLVSYVFQEHQLLADTVANNIRLGYMDASEEQIVDAAQKAGADEFIQRMPEKYQTLIGQAGANLSVGQKQRISIARGLVKTCPILILDEPTAALDPEAEQTLIDILDDMRADHLIIIIAHRLSTIRRANRILFMEEGKLIEEGSHEELLAARGAYFGFMGIKDGRNAG